MTRRRRAGVAIALVAMLALGACGGDPEPVSQVDPAAGPPGTGLDPGTAPEGSVLVVAVADMVCAPTDEPMAGGPDGVGAVCQQDATAALVRPEVEAILVPGDLQYESATLEDFETAYAASWGRFRDITIPAPGNHEYRTDGGAGYHAYFGDRVGTPGESWYSTDVGAWHVVSLNSNCGAVGGCGTDSAQYAWLQDDLAASDAACTVALWHHPRFSTGAYGDTEEMAAMWELLDDAGAELVLSGHEHTYERFVPMSADGTPVDDGMRQWIVGMGGKNHYPADARDDVAARDNTTFGVLELLLEPDGYAWEYVAADGDYHDAGRASCR